MSSSTQPTSLSPRLLNIILIGVGIVFALIIVGAALLFFPQLRPNTIQFTVAMGDIFYHQGPWMRPVENPNQPLSIHWLAWDAEGFRVPHRTADRYPVVALGDSFTEAANVGRPWPDALASALDRPVRNLGFRGFGPREEMQAFELYGDAADVDIVVIGFFEGNDLSNAVTSRGRDFQPPSEVTDREMIPTDVSAIAERDERYPMQVELAGGAQDIAFLEGYVWANTGAVETYADSANLNLTARSWRRILEQAPDACVVLAYFPVKSHVYLPYLSEAGRARLIEKAELTLLNDSGELAQRQEPLAFDALLAARGNQRDAVLARAEAEGLATIDLTPVLETAAASGEMVYYTYDTHWNQRGHDLVGEAIGRAIAGGLCQAVLP
ncbi:MAG: hypothetical protein IPM16_05285 [Chloroflexi bacterium]|nr:hypothetical protein [Chloroflexota bacterium]